MTLPGTAQVVLAFLVAALVSLSLGPALIPLLYRLKFGQEVRREGPPTHLRKRGTATMGGILIIAGTGAAVITLAPRSEEALFLLGVMCASGLLGFADDFLKVVLRRPLGLRARSKILGQLLVGVFLVAGAQALGRGTAVEVAALHLARDLGSFYFLLGVVVLVATANAVNLSDGLDGLAAGLMVIAGLAYTYIGLRLGREEVALFAAALAGGCLGFLRFNSHPARVFMGDTGSLALGGALAGLAVLTRTELVLLVLGGVFVLEALSVIIQVASFRLTGRRVFRMSPLHHHFELLGWPEPKVVYFFWFLGICGALLGSLLAL